MNRPGAIIIEGHVQGLSNTRSLGEAGIPVYVVDKMNCIARYSRYCQKFFLCPDFITDEFAVFLIDLAKQENIKDWVLLPSNDHAVYTISKNIEKLSRYYKIISPSFNIYKNIYNKKKSIEICQRIGVDTPATFFPEKYPINNFNLKFPVIIKGIEGLSFYKSVGSKSLDANNIYELNERIIDLRK